MDVLHGPQTRVAVPTASRLADSDQITVPYRDMDANMWKDTLDCPFPKFDLMHCFSLVFFV